MLEPPYVKAQERPELDDDGELTEESKLSIETSGWDGIGRNPAPAAVAAEGGNGSGKARL